MASRAIVGAGSFPKGVEVDVAVDLLHQEVNGVLRGTDGKIDVGMGDRLVKLLNACFELCDHLGVLCWKQLTH